MESLALVEPIRSLKMKVRSYRADNEKMLKAQVEQNKLNTQLLHSLNHLQKKMING
jgi:hypothetical protein